MVPKIINRCMHRSLRFMAKHHKQIYGRLYLYPVQPRIKRSRPVLIQALQVLVILQLRGAPFQLGHLKPHPLILPILPDLQATMHSLLGSRPRDQTMPFRHHVITSPVALLTTKVRTLPREVAHLLLF